MDAQEEWKYLNEYLLFHHLEHHNFTDIAIHSALEIDYYLREGKIRSNNFSKLKQILINTLRPDLDLNGQRKIDSYLDTGKYLKEVFDSHKESNEQTPYKLEGKITSEDELTKGLAKVITQVAKDLENLSRLPKEKLETLKNLCKEFTKVGRKYERDFRRYMVA